VLLIQIRITLADGTSRLIGQRSGLEGLHRPHPHVPIFMMRELRRPPGKERLDPTGIRRYRLNLVKAVDHSKTNLVTPAGPPVRCIQNSAR